jgi:hypothetical protein
MAASVPLKIPALLQQFEEIVTSPMPDRVGWEGFSQYEFLFEAFLVLGLAAVLGAVIGYHPFRVRAADTLEEIEAPKVSIMYSVIGALIGILVVEHGLVVGFVLFGMGGLMRFRTALRSAHLTGQVILVTMIGLSCGLDLPHVAVLATGFGFVLILLLESRVTYQVDIRGIEPNRFGEAVAAYRAALENNGCRILAEKKRPGQGRLNFILRKAGRGAREEMAEVLETEVDAALKGSSDWEVD